MTTKKADLDFILTVLEECVWREVSIHFLWTEQLLENYINKVDWEFISSNNDMLWTNSIIDKYKRLINWKELSSSQDGSFYTEERLTKYKDYWDWKELSRTISNIELLDKFIDKWVWEDIINNYSLKDYFNIDFLEKYIEYIPKTSLRKSGLWDYLIDSEAEKIKQQITA